VRRYFRGNPAELLFCCNAVQKSGKWDGPAVLSGLSAGKRGHSAMARTYRDIAIEEMLGTVEEAMSQVIDWWGDLPPPMKEAIEEFRTQLGAAIDSVEFVKRALDRQVHETDRGKGPA
jgi:hypothetical protein